MRRAKFTVALLVLLLCIPQQVTAAPQMVPSNDNFLAATTISLPGHWSGNTSGATMEANEPAPCGYLGASVWYKFTAPVTGRVDLTTLTNDIDPPNDGYFDTVLALYQVNPGSLGNSFSDLTLEDCNDDVPYGRSVRSAINFWQPGITQGYTYFIQLGGYQNWAGNYDLHVSYRNFNDQRPCSGNYTSWGSVTCKTTGIAPAPKQDGFQASWASNALNISNDSALAGEFIAQAVWFYDLGSTDQHWLEIGDTAGSGKIDGHQNYWERWWYWVDGSNYPTTYIEHGISTSPNDGATRTYIIQWEASESQWAVYICSGGTCTREGATPWISPSAMGSQFEETGLEVSVDDNNLNSNSPVFQDAGIQSRTFYYETWSSWDGNNVSWEIAAGCGFGYPTNFCLNGSWNAGPPPYDNWRNNKP